MLPIQPLRDFILLKPLDEEVSATGLALAPRAVHDGPRRGVVLAVGSGRRTEEGHFVPPRVRAGDVVLYGSRTGTDVRVGSVVLLLVGETDILARILD